MSQAHDSSINVAANPQTSVSDVQRAIRQFKLSIDQSLDTCKQLLTDAVAKLEQDLAAIVNQPSQPASSSSPSSQASLPLRESQSLPLPSTSEFVASAPVPHSPVTRGLLHLDVGGQHFSTSLATITHQPNSMLAAMFSGRHQTATDAEGRVFIDRDGELFRHVLAFLREGEHWEPPSDESLWKRLQREFQFYGLVTGFEPPDPSSSAVEEERHHVQPAVQFLYAIGGASSTANMERYSADGDRWDALPGPAEPVHTYMAATTLDGNMYILGGKSMNGPLLDSVFMYSPQRYVWQTIAPLSSARAGLAAVACAGRLYAMGGKLQGSQYLDVVERYDPGTDAWTQVAPMTSPRDGLAAVELDGAIYAMGGKPTYNAYLNTMERYDPREGRWTLLAPMRLRRQGLMAVAHQDRGGVSRIFAMGGYADSSCFREVEIFEPRSGAWTAGAPLFEARYAGAAAVLGGAVYVLGGWNGNRELSSMERLDEEEVQAGPGGRWKPAKSMIRPRQFLAAAAL